jgi:hypothetical protein
MFGLAIKRPLEDSPKIGEVAGGGRGKPEPHKMMTTHRTCGGESGLKRAPMLLALAGLSISTAQAADEVLTLVCQGITLTRIGATDQPTREPISTGIIANLTARTVEGLPVEDLPVKIRTADRATIRFEGSDPAVGFTRRVTGTIDRVTGEMFATFTMQGAGEPAVVSFSLKCKPTQKMF